MTELWRGQLLNREEDEGVALATRQCTLTYDGTDEMGRVGTLGLASLVLDLRRVVSVERPRDSTELT